MALGIEGERNSDPDLLKRSLMHIDEAFKRRSFADSPFHWAHNRSNRARALLAIAQLTDDEKLVEEAVEAAGSALEVFTKSKDQLIWATEYSTLGNALVELGRMTNDTQKVKEGIAALQSALEVISVQGPEEQTQVTISNLARAEDILRIML